MKLKRVRGMCVHLLRLASLLGARCCTAWRAVCSITPLTMCRVLPVCVVVPQGMTAVSAAEALTGALPCVKRQVCVCLRLRHAPPALLSCTVWLVACCITLRMIVPCAAVVHQGMAAVSTAGALAEALLCVKRQACACLCVRHAPPELHLLGARCCIV